MSDIINLIGIENYTKLCKHLGGQQLYVPKQFAIEERNKQIHKTFTELLQIGSTCMNAYQTIAQDTNLSTRRIQQIISEN